MLEKWYYKILYYINSVSPPHSNIETLFNIHVTGLVTLFLKKDYVQRLVPRDLWGQTNFINIRARIVTGSIRPSGSYIMADLLSTSRDVQLGKYKFNLRTRYRLYTNHHHLQIYEHQYMNINICRVQSFPIKKYNLFKIHGIEFSVSEKANRFTIKSFKLLICITSINGSINIQRVLQRLCKT